MTDELITRVLARASDPATIHDNTKYWTAVPKIYLQATPEQIASTQAAIGFELPHLLGVVARSFFDNFSLASGLPLRMFFSVLDPFRHARKSKFKLRKKHLKTGCYCSQIKV